MAMYIPLFSAVYSRYLEARDDAPYIRQFNLAALLLLDLLAAKGATIFYSGDFDPEGLQMAQRLVRRYGIQLKLWHYNLEDYEACQPGKELNDSRLKKLDSISAHSLLQVKERMLITREARFQEKIIALLIVDLQRHCDNRF